MQATSDPVATAPSASVAQTVITTPIAGSPANVYTARRDQRNELRSQLERLEEKRSDLRRQMQERDGDPSDPGIAARLTELDARISATDAQLAAADAAVATAAAVPGAIQPEPQREDRTDPAEIVGIISGVSAVLLFPFVIAYSRRIWRRGATVIAPVPADVRDRLDHLASAVESIGVEVERIGEGQRFITKVMSEPSARAALGQPPAAPLAVGQRDAVPAPRYQG